MIKFLMKKLLPPPDLLKYERYVFVSAHPDDIEIGAGGTVARLKAMGKYVVYIIATDGRYGGETPDVLPQDLIEVRAHEARAAAAHLGVDEVVLLGFSDGGGYDREFLTKSIAGALAAAEPDIIFTIDHQVPNELHPDHLNVGAACSTAALMYRNHHYMKNLGFDAAARPLAGIAYFFTNNPNRFVGVKKYFKKQIEAMSLHESQMQTYEGRSLADVYKYYIALRAVRFGLRRGRLMAEGFRVLSTVHMHCAPEISER